MQDITTGSENKHTYVSVEDVIYSNVIDNVSLMFLHTNCSIMNEGKYF